MSLARKLKLRYLGPSVVVVCTTALLLISFGGYHNPERPLSYDKVLQLSQHRNDAYIQDTVRSHDELGQRNNKIVTLRNQGLRTVADEKEITAELSGNQVGKVPYETAPGSIKKQLVASVVDGEWRPPVNAGEEGSGVMVNRSDLSEKQRQRLDKGQQLHGFNELVSSLISLHRSLPPRLNEHECRFIQYRSDLPDASVVIIFYNEAWSALLRTVHSVLDRSPPHLLRQVILVDDFSDLADLGLPLDDYVSRLDKVSVVRATSREGLIRARLLGLRHVTATTVVFLDSHCECAQGWLEPLLSRIAEDPSHVVVPTIMTIDPKTFEYQQGSLENIYVGKFTWELFFKWSHIQPQEKARRNSSVDPVRSPTMAGGLFAIDRDYFYKLGTYDPGMKIWGGENLELSFKIWMCGGTLEMLPCSNVGHVFRAHAVVSSYRHVTAVNLARLAAVWLDDYIVYYHQARPQYRHVEPGDVSARKALRRRLQCHSFAWYMKHVLPEDLLPADTMRPKAIFNEFFKSCIGRRGDQLLVVKNCTQAGRHTWFTGWKMNKEQGIIHYGVSCLHYDRGKFKLQKCQDKGGNQAWKYIQELKQLYHTNTKSCVELVKEYKRADGLNLLLSPCNHDNPRQQWLWDTSPPPGPSWRKDEAAGITVV